jgi:membrane protein required for colicin V production
LTKLANFAALGILNKLLGGLFGGLKIALILSVLVLIFNSLNKSIPFVSDEEIEASILYNPVKSLAPMVFPSFIDEEKPLELPTIPAPSSE